MNLNFDINKNNDSLNVLDLKKNDVLNLTKRMPSLKKLVLGAGWDTADTGPSFDLDIAAFLLDEHGRVANPSTDVIYFNHLKGQGIMLEGDNLTGAGDGDDEKIDIELDAISPSVKRIVFFVTIYDAINKHQTFGMVQNSYVRLLNAEDNMKEVLRYPLKENFSTETAVTFAELFKEDTLNGPNWSFKAIGEGDIKDLNGLLANYL